jgi:hypothetical protein
MFFINGFILRLSDKLKIQILPILLQSYLPLVIIRHNGAQQSPEIRRMVLMHHMAIRATNSLFPQSAYMIGLKQGWIFTAPFHTFPLQYIPNGTWGMVDGSNVEERTNQAIALIEELIPTLKTSPNADNPTT